MPPARPTLLRAALPARRAFGLLPAVGVLAAGALGSASSGCYYTSDGLSPPPEQIYFPTGLAVSPGRTALYIANSDFDLQYNGGTVQVIDLVSVRARVDTILSGVRCTQGYADACATFLSDCPPAPGANTYTQYCPSTAPTSVEQVCNSVRMSEAGMAPTGTQCTAATDCASSNCIFGSNTVFGVAVGVCGPCSTSLDCPGSPGGVCAAGVCVLDTEENQILEPAVCTSINPPLKSVATIGAFASGAVLADNPAGPATGSRLFVPVRGDPSITWFDVADDREVDGTKLSDGQACTAAADCQSRLCTNGACTSLDCGQGPALSGQNRCDDNHRMGVDPFDNFRDLTLPVQPVGLDVTVDGRWLVSAHQITGNPAVGLSQNTWTATDAQDFEFYLSGGGVAAGPTEVGHIPPPAVVAWSSGTSAPIAYQPGFLVTYNLTPEIDLFRVDDDHLSSPPRPFLTRAQQGTISVNASGSDSRGIAIDASERQTCEAACAATPTSCPPVHAGDTPDTGTCLRCCASTPLRLFVANRAPPTLLIGQVLTTIVDSDVGDVTGSGAFDTVSFYDNAPLSTGPSKVALGKVIASDGSLSTRVFAVAFDTRFIYVFDPLAPDELPAQPIRTGRGPDAIAFDACCDPTVPTCQAADQCPAGETPHAYLYVGHFTDSYLGVVDLDMRRPETFGTMFASVGVPLPPLESH